MNLYFKQWLESNPFPTQQMVTPNGPNPYQFVPGKNSEKNQPPPLGETTPNFPKNKRSFAKKT